MRLLKKIESQIDNRLALVSNNYFRSNGGVSFPVLVNSIPKSGTHLLGNLIKSLPYNFNAGTVVDGDKFSNPGDRLNYLKKNMPSFKKGAIYLGHVPFSDLISSWLIQKKVKHVFIYRDPRDVSVSLLHYVNKNIHNHPYGDIFKSYSNNQERLHAIINGHGKGRRDYELSDSSIPNIFLYNYVYLGWLNDPNTFTIKYEDLTGSLENSLFHFNELLEFLEVNTSKLNAEKIFLRGSNPQKSATFRSGGSGKWIEEYNENHIRAFYNIGGEELLLKMNYPI